MRSVEVSKEWQNSWLGEKCDIILHDFVRLLHTSTHLRSVELSKEWQEDRD